MTHDEALKITNSISAKLRDQFDELFPKDWEAEEGIRPSKSNRSAAIVLWAEMLMAFKEELEKLP